MDIIPDPRTLIVQSAGFLLVLLVFVKFLFKPIRDILDARRAEIEAQYSDAESRMKTAEELKSSYEQHLANVQEEIRQKIAEAVKEGQAIREEIISDSRAQAEQIISKAREEVARETEKAKIQLKATVADLAVDAAGKLIEEKLDPETHRKLVEKFIDDLEGAQK